MGGCQRRCFPRKRLLVLYDRRSGFGFQPAGLKDSEDSSDAIQPWGSVVELSKPFRIGPFPRGGHTQNSQRLDVVPPRLGCRACLQEKRSSEARPLVPQLFACCARDGGRSALSHMDEGSRSLVRGLVDRYVPFGRGVVAGWRCTRRDCRLEPVLQSLTIPLRDLQ